MIPGVDQVKALVERRRKRKQIRQEQLAGAKRKLEQARRLLARVRRDNAKWNGSRGVVNEVIRIVNGRAAISSRKRAADDPLSKANPGSDHNKANVLADAVDFKIANATSLRNEVSLKLGGPPTLADFGTFNVVRDGRIYRVQLISGTHGTGPHFHVGVKFVGTRA